MRIDVLLLWYVVRGTYSGYVCSEGVGFGYVFSLLLKYAMRLRTAGCVRFA